MLKRIRNKFRRLTVPFRIWLAKRAVFLSDNDRRLWSLKNRHKGETAVVIGMGPSLRPDDLDRFRHKV